MPKTGEKEVTVATEGAQYHQTPTDNPSSFFGRRTSAPPSSQHPTNSFFRSAPMTLIQVYIPTEAVQAVVAEMGELGCVQFRDLNPETTAFQRTFTSEIRRLDEMERKIRILLEQATKEGVSLRSWSVSGNTSGGNYSLVPMRGRALHELEELEPELEEMVSRIVQLDENQQEISRQYLRMLEWHSVLVALSPHLAVGRGAATDATSSSLGSGAFDGKGGSFRRGMTPSTAIPDLAGTGTLDVLTGAPSALTFATTTTTATSDTDAHLSAADRDIHSLTEEGGEEAAREAAETSFVAGAIAKKKLAAFERVLWRALRGNVYVRSADCVMAEGATVMVGDNTEDALLTFSNGTFVAEPKSAFVAYVHGRETLSRLRRICEALGCRLYEISPDARRRHELLEELTGKLDDMYAVLFNTRQAKRAALHRISESLERWMLLVRKKKLLFDAMNRFACDADPAARKYYIAEGWCPTMQLGLLDGSIRMASERAGVQVAPVLTTLDPFHGSGGGSSSNSSGEYGGGAANNNVTGGDDDNNNATQQKTSSTPHNGSSIVIPTYFPTNKFTSTFQDMTDSYGVGSYGEANPSLFMIVSFPFLFAVMFGDVGHGLMMALFAAWMVLDERRLLSQSLDEIFEMIFGGRYILLLMGIFSVFTGLIYNDIFSRTLTLFPTMWTVGNAPVGGNVTEITATRKSPHYTYPFGIDPTWALSGNAMLFLNSYKMKLAIILGVTQMLFGLCISGTNSIASGSWLNIWTTLIPQMLFMLSIFGYLVVLILYKWLAGWDISILNTLIGMVMKFGAIDPDSTPIYPGQSFIQRLLMIIALICIPWMFLAKPLFLIWQRRKLQAQRNQPAYHVAPDTSDSTENTPTAASISSTTRKAAVDEEEHEMGELWVHQLIHTIEFVLGSVSNTASYLRLWALSLAHAQLSEVLWKMTIEKVVTQPYLLFPIFLLWLAFTVAILVAMEGMSAFLHALRLHWVEFNNKFYQGTGVKFEPFTLANDRQLLTMAMMATEKSNKSS